MPRPSKFDGRWSLGAPPNGRMLPHNERTWTLVHALLSKQGHAEYRALVELAKDHEKTTPQAFVAHCIHSGWIARAGR